MADNGVFRRAVDDVGDLERGVSSARRTIETNIPGIDPDFSARFGARLAGERSTLRRNEAGAPGDFTFTTTPEERAELVARGFLTPASEREISMSQLLAPSPPDSLAPEPTLFTADRIAELMQLGLLDDETAPRAADIPAPTPVQAAAPAAIAPAAPAATPAPATPALGLEVPAAAQPVRNAPAVTQAPTAPAAAPGAFGFGAPDVRQGLANLPAATPPAEEEQRDLRAPGAFLKAADALIRNQPRQTGPVPVRRLPPAPARPARPPVVFSDRDLKTDITPVDGDEIGEALLSFTGN